MNKENTIQLSVVIPVFNEEKGLFHFIGQLEETFKDLSQYELIFVDDGSSDNTWDIIKNKNQSNKRVRGIRFSRNFGHQPAIMAGLRAVKGDFVGIMDGDGQDPPDVLKEMFEKCLDSYDVVYAVRKKRESGLVKKLAYLIYYRIINQIVPFDMPLDSGDFSVMKRKVVDFITLQKEQFPYIRGLRSWYGGEQLGIEYNRPGRMEGESKYSYKKLLILAIQGITSFSKVPLRIATVVGVIISLGGIVYGLFNIIRKLFFGLPYPGYTSLIVAVTFLGGLQILLLGIIGEYIGNIFEDQRSKPQYIIDEGIE